MLLRAAIRRIIHQPLAFAPPPSPSLLARGLAASALLRYPSPSPATPQTPPTTATTPTTPTTPGAAAPLQTGSLQVTPPPPAQPHPSLALLSALKAQPSQYITIHIQGFPFLVTVGDLIRLSFRIKEVNVGDKLQLTHASVLGSRDYTLKGNPYISTDLFVCRATVVEETSEPMRKKEKTKRRQRRTKTVKSKHPYTVLRISELVIHDTPKAAAVTDTAMAAVGEEGKALEA